MEISKWIDLRNNSMDKAELVLRQAKKGLIIRKHFLLVDTNKELVLEIPLLYLL